MGSARWSSRLNTKGRSTETEKCLYLPALLYLKRRSLRLSIAADADKINFTLPLDLELTQGDMLT